MYNIMLKEFGGFCKLMINASIGLYHRQIAFRNHILLDGRNPIGSIFRLNPIRDRGNPLFLYQSLSGFISVTMGYRLDKRSDDRAHY
jgi:hypothetical protein